MPINPHKTAKLNPTVGTLPDGRTLKCFIPIIDCIKEECCVFHMCTYKKNGQCRLEAEYLLPRFRMYVDEEKGLGDELTDFELAGIGELMSLEHILFKLLKEIIPLKQMSYKDSKGTRKIFPQIAEAKKTIKDIDAKRRELDLPGRWRKKFGKKTVALPGSGDMEKMLIHGDPDFTDSLLEDEEEE